MKRTPTTWGVRPRRVCRAAPASSSRDSALHRLEQQWRGLRHDLADDFRERLARDRELLGERLHDAQVLLLGPGADRTEPMRLHHLDEDAMDLVDFAVHGIRKWIGLVE